jgi:hypothetical protein
LKKQKERERVARRRKKGKIQKAGAISERKRKKHKK